MIHAFKALNKYLLLDVESGSVFLTDELTYRVAPLYKKHAPAAIHALLNGAFSLADIEACAAELAGAEEEGYLYSEYPQADMEKVEKHEAVLKAMCLHAAHDCNLRCKYCFAKTGSFHGSRSFMTTEVAKAALKMLVEKSKNRKHLEVDFFGGEPTMNFGMVKETVAYGRELEKEYGKVIRFTMTTNAFDFPEDMMDFCNREMYNVVISIDGRQSVHDFMRPDVKGAGTYAPILENARRFVAMRGEKSHYIRGTFTSQNLDFAEDVRFLADEGFREISLEPVVLPDSHPYALKEEHLPALFDEYEKLAELYLARKNTPGEFNFFHFHIDLEGGPCLPKRVCGCGAGNEYVAVTPEGDIYPCHQFAGEAPAKMGNVKEGVLNSGMQKNYAACNVLSKPECRDCWAKYYCSGGCAANAYHFNKNIYKPYALGCQLEKKRVECALALAAISREAGE